MQPGPCVCVSVAALVFWCDGLVYTWCACLRPCKWLVCLIQLIKAASDIALLIAAAHFRHLWQPKHNASCLASGRTFQGCQICSAASLERARLQTAAWHQTGWAKTGQLVWPGPFADWYHHAREQWEQSCAGCNRAVGDQYDRPAACC